jgi:biotin transport system substrate-specific component
MSIAQATIVDRFVPRTIVNNISLVLGGALITALAAQVQIPMWPVPLTLQTFAVLLVGATLGAGRGAASLSVYLAMGAAGLPVSAFDTAY